MNIEEVRKHITKAKDGDVESMKLIMKHHRKEYITQLIANADELVRGRIQMLDELLQDLF